MTEPGTPTSYAVVIPTIGRPSLDRLLQSLRAQTGSAPAEIIVVDDRPHTPAFPELRPGAGSGPGSPIAGPFAGLAADRPRVLRSYGRGPAAARNVGWRAATAEWIAFLDDDVELPQGWGEALERDLLRCGTTVAGSQGQLVVPLPAHRRPTDWERATAGLQGAAWATADMAYRRSVLASLGGFDERFPRAYREDADLAIRVRRAGWELARGQRVTMHPVRPASDWISLRVQRGNADDALMRALHGPGWRAAGQVPRGRFRSHVATLAAGLAVPAGLVLRRRARSGRPAVSPGPAWSPSLTVAGALAWTALTARFAVQRLAPGPRPGDPRWWPEVRRMLLTSPAIPPAAVIHRVRGFWQWRTAAPSWPLRPRAILFDRDGTLVVDVPYNGDPGAVRLVGDAAAAVSAARSAGMRIGVITNQSGIARGLLTRDQVDAVNREIDRQLGGLETWQVCPHSEQDGCACRKPGPLMIQRAAAVLGVRPQECVIIGDIGADVGAARAAGARAILVPAAQTRAEEIAGAPLTAGSLASAVRLAIDPPPELRHRHRSAARGGR